MKRRGGGGGGRLWCGVVVLESRVVHEFIIYWRFNQSDVPLGILWIWSPSSGTTFQLCGPVWSFSLSICMGSISGIPCSSNDTW